MKRILRHVGGKDFKKTHQRKLDEQNLLWQEEERKYSNIQEIKRLSERFKSDWRTELSEAMSSKDFPYIYGGVVTVDILSLTNLPGSQFAQNSIQYGANQTDYAFGSEFPGSYVNSIGDIPSVVASAVDSWDSVNDLVPSGWTPENSDEYDYDTGDFSGVVSSGQETIEFKDTHFGEVHLSGDRITIHTGDDGDPNTVSEIGDSTVAIEDLQTLFPGITFPQSLPSPDGNELVAMDPVQASMILRTFKDVRVGDKLSFNYSFDTLETEEDDAVSYRGGALFPRGEDSFVDDYAFVIIGDSIKGKIVSVLARDGNNIDFNFNYNNVDFKPDVLQGRFPLTGKYEYTVTKDDIDDYGNVKFFVGVMDVESGTYQSTLDITSLSNETRAAAGKLGKVTGAYDLGAPVSALDPGHRERRGIERVEIINIQTQIKNIQTTINSFQKQIDNLRTKEQAELDAYNASQESFMDNYLKVQEKWAKIIDPLQYEFQTKYIGQMGPKGLADKINSLIAQQDAELEALTKASNKTPEFGKYDSQILELESKIGDLENQQIQKQNDLQLKKQKEFNYNEYLKSLPPDIRADAERGGQTKDLVSNLVDIGIGSAVAKILVTAIGPASASAVTKGAKILDKAKEWWNKGRNVRVKDENNASWKELWADDLAQRGQSDASFAAGKPPRGIGRPDQAFNPFRPASKGGPGSGPTPAVRQAFERPFRSLMNLFQSYEYAGSLLSEQSNSDEAFYDAMDKALKQIKTIGQFKELIKFLEVSAQQKGGEKKGGALYPGQPSPNGFPDNPPAQLAPNGYHPEFGKRANRYRTLDPVSARTMARVMTGDPETDSQVAAAARQPKVAPQKSTTWRRAKKHLRRA